MSVLVSISIAAVTCSSAFALKWKLAKAKITPITTHSGFFIVTKKIHATNGPIRMYWDPG